MLTRPLAMLAELAPFAPRFSGRVWRHAQVLLAGAILAPARRTVTAALWAVGLAQLDPFHRYHRVLGHARWSGLAVGRVLLSLRVATFAPGGRLVIGVEETLERRRGAKIAAKGIYRDPVRSSRRHFVKASGLRWVGPMLPVPVPWAGRAWALPFLTARAPSERSDRERGRRHKPLTDWARQLLRAVRRWWPDRPLVAVADRTYAALESLAACGAWARPVTGVTRLRLEAGLSEPARPRRPGQRGRPRVKGRRLPTRAAQRADRMTRWRSITIANWYGPGERPGEVAAATAVWYHSGRPPVPLRGVLIRDPQGRFAPPALLGTDPAADPAQILARFVVRWQLEVTCEDARRHLGLETQRHWSAAAIRRATPAVLGLFSLVTPLAHPRLSAAAPAIRQAAWYRKRRPTFADAPAVVRRDLWWHQVSHSSAPGGAIVKLPRRGVEHLTDTLCYAA